jgi:perosamine synthetase
MPAMNIPLVKPALGEEEVAAVSQAIRSSWINEGEKVRQFEEAVARYTGTRHGVAFFNGTVALHTALLALGIGPGHEVIVPSFTFFSTVSSVVHVGATPVFADVSETNFGLDPLDVERRITGRTKAVMPVHYGGFPAEMAEIVSIADDHGIAVIEDAAESLGAEYRGRKVGRFGKTGMFSFTPSKVITTGEGGMLVTDDDDLASRFRLLKNHGQDRQYHHLFIGYNYRMTELQAAMGLAQMERLEGILSAKRKVALKITKGLEGVQGVRTPRGPSNGSCTYTLYTILLQSRRMRDHLALHLQERGITTRVYFPPAHLQPVFAARRCSLPVTERLGETSLSLPCYGTMTDGEIEYLCDCIRAVVREVP